MLGPAAGGSRAPLRRRSAGNINRHVTTRPRGIPITAPSLFLPPPRLFPFIFYFPPFSPLFPRSYPACPAEGGRAGASGPFSVAAASGTAHPKHASAPGCRISKHQLIMHPVQTLKKKRRRRRRKITEMMVTCKFLPKLS